MSSHRSPQSSQPKVADERTDPGRTGCGEIAALLPWWINETLEGGERRLVEEHLGTCLVCRRELSQLRSLLAATEDHVPAEDLVGHALGLPAIGWSESAIAGHVAKCGECQDLFDTVCAVEGQVSRVRGTGRRRVERRHFGYHLAAAGLALCVVGLGTLQMLSGKAPALPQRASVEAGIEERREGHQAQSQDSTYLFAEGFESGDPTRWSLLVVQGGDAEGDAEVPNRRKS